MQTSGRRDATRQFGKYNSRFENIMKIGKWAVERVSVGNYIHVDRQGETSHFLL